MSFFHGMIGIFKCGHWMVFLWTTGRSIDRIVSGFVGRYIKQDVYFWRHPPPLQLHLLLSFAVDGDLIKMESGGR